VLTPNEDQAKDLSLSSLPEDDYRTAVHKPLSNLIFNHRNVGHKKHAQLTGLDFHRLADYHASVASLNFAFGGS
jgi:hypothetical protein